MVGVVEAKERKVRDVSRIGEGQIDRVDVIVRVLACLGRGELTVSRSTDDGLVGKHALREDLVKRRSNVARVPVDVVRERTAKDKVRVRVDSGMIVGDVAGLEEEVVCRCRSW